MSVRAKSGILNREMIKSELEAGRLFQKGTWDERSLRSAGYDVRLAPDLMFVPDSMSERGARYYSRGSHRRAEIILQPGDTAFVSTVERLCLPWDVSAAVGPKFGLTAKGILMLTGFLIDPGYGLTRNAQGAWVAEPDQRLHFFFANVGPLPVSLNPGQEAIATLQFSWVAESSIKRETPSTGFGLIHDAFLRGDQAPQGALLFFKSLADLKISTADIRREIDVLEARVAGVEAGTGQIVLFGVYLISATFLGIIFAMLIGISQEGELMERLAGVSSVIERGWLGLLTFGLAIAGLAMILTKAAKAARNWFVNTRS